jgi:hypothetical protein
MLIFAQPMAELSRMAHEKLEKEHLAHYIPLTFLDDSISSFLSAEENIEKYLNPSQRVFRFLVMDFLSQMLEKNRIEIHIPDKIQPSPKDIIMIFDGDRNNANSVGKLCALWRITVDWESVLYKHFKIYNNSRELLISSGLPEIGLDGEGRNVRSKLELVVFQERIISLLQRVYELCVKNFRNYLSSPDKEIRKSSFNKRIVDAFGPNIKNFLEVDDVSFDKDGVIHIKCWNYGDDKDKIIKSVNDQTLDLIFRNWQLAILPENLEASIEGDTDTNLLLKMISWIGYFSKEDIFPKVLEDIDSSNAIIFSARDRNHKDQMNIVKDAEYFVQNSRKFQEMSADFENGIRSVIKDNTSILVDVKTTKGYREIVGVLSKKMQKGALVASGGVALAALSTVYALQPDNNMDEASEKTDDSKETDDQKDIENKVWE